MSQAPRTRRLILNRVGLLAALALAALPTARADELKTIDGQGIALKATGRKATVLLFYSSECPISNAYSPTYRELVGEYRKDRGQPVVFVGICVDPDLSDAEVLAHAREYSLPFGVVRDRDGALASKYGAKVVPEAFVLDGEGRVRYHGRIDDQFAARRKRNSNPKTHELRDAIAAVVAGKPVEKEYVEAVGCPIPEPKKAVAAPTFSGRVAAILQKNCQDCHRPGQVGPFPLMTYEQARKRADDLARVVEDRQMPPWKPAPDIGPKFKHSRALSAEDVASVVAWAEAGAPQGDPSQMPPPVYFNDNWALGTPDLILEPAEDFAIPADGDDIYRCFVIPTDLPEDRYIAAIEYRPGNRRVVHHVLSYVDVAGQGRKRDEADPGPGYSCFSGPGIEIHGDLGGWAPGNEPNFLPEGVGRSLPKKADVVMQVHYHPSGKPETDRTRMGIYFSKKPVKQVLHWTGAADPEHLILPAGEKGIEIRAEYEIPADVEARAVTPHMHLLGRDIAMSVVYPDKTEKDLVKIADWDFNWQNTYYFETPIDLPKGTILRVVGHFDNSADNPRNPNHPPREVKWGEATTDEMCIGFLAVTLKGQDLTQPGAEDELRKILHDQREQFQRKREEAARKQGKTD